MDLAISPTKPRTHRVAVSLFFFIAGLVFASWASRIPDIQTKLGLSEAALGGVLFALPMGQLVSLPLSGFVIGKFGSRQLVILSAILYALILILISAASTTVMLIIALFFFGFWANLINISMNTQAVGVENLYGRSIMASFHGLWSLAGFTGAAIGSVAISNKLSPLSHFAVIVVLVGILIMVAYKNTLQEQADPQKQQPIFVKPDKRILILGVIAFCCMVCEGAMFDWSGVYFKKVVNAPVSLTALGYVAFMATMATGRFLGDWLITRFGVQQILLSSGLLIAGGLSLSILVPQLVTAVIGFLLVGFGVSCVVPMVYALAGKSRSMPPAMALAAVSTISFLGFLLGPPVIGFIAEWSSLRLSFAVVGLLGLGTTLMSLRLHRVLPEIRNRSNHL